MKWLTALDYWGASKLAIMVGFGWMTSFVFGSNELYTHYAMHNEFIRVMFETGILGLFFYISFLRAVWKSACRIRIAQNREFLMLILAVFLIGSLSGNLLGVPENTMYFFIIFACANGIENRGERFESITCNQHVSK